MMTGSGTAWMTINRRQSVNGADYGILFGRIGEKRTRIFQHFSQIPCNPCIRIASVSPNFKQAWMCLDIQEVFQYSEQDLVEFVKSAFIYTAVGKRSERLELPVKVRVVFRFFFLFRLLVAESAIRHGRWQVCLEWSQKQRIFSLCIYYNLIKIGSE